MSGAPGQSDFTNRISWICQWFFFCNLVHLSRDISVGPFAVAHLSPVSQ